MDIHENFTKETLDQLNKEELVSLCMALKNKNDLMGETMQKLLANQFGRKSEKNVEGQITAFNESEVCADSNIKEPDAEVVVPSYKRQKAVGKKATDLSKLPWETIEYKLDKNTLNEFFQGEAFTVLSNENKPMEEIVYIPATLKVIRHIVYSYVGKKTGKFIKAPHPKKLINNSCASASLVAAIMDSKYTNAMPLYRQEQEFKRLNYNIGRQNMANWIIKCSEDYLKPVWDYMHMLLQKESVLQADETPVIVVKDGRNAGSKSYIWEYRTSEMKKKEHIILFDYNKTRAGSNPHKFLGGFKGVLECDGYSGYAAMASNTANITLSSCFAHARRKFMDALKTADNKKDTIASEAVERIAKIYMAYNKIKDLPVEEQEKRRRQEVLPLVEAYFAWLKLIAPETITSSLIGKAIQYSLNREESLKVFCNNVNVPIDNNASERSIKSVVLGRKNWVIIDTEKGADASATIYSIVETAKANGLIPCKYIEYLLQNLSQNIDQVKTSYLETLLPWSSSIPDSCRVKN